MSTSNKFGKNTEYIIFYAMTFTVALSLNSVATKALEIFSEGGSGKFMDVFPYIVYFIIIIVLDLALAYVLNYDLQSVPLPGATY